MLNFTEIRIKLVPNQRDKLRAFASITLDDALVIRDIKIIDGGKRLFVAMPSRKLTDRCPKCYMKNHLRATHCNQCGAKLDEARATKDNDGRAKLYADIAHPIKSECRELIQDSVLTAYENELIRAKDPGYICSYDDYGEECFAALDQSENDEADSGSPNINHVQPKTEPETVAATPVPAPPTYHQNGSTTHRIEPAAQKSPGPPHRRIEEPSRSPYRDKSRVSQMQSASNDEDSFGAGIV